MVEGLETAVVGVVESSGVLELPPEDEEEQAASDTVSAAAPTPISAREDVAIFRVSLVGGTHVAGVVVGDTGLEPVTSRV